MGYDVQGAVLSGGKGTRFWPFNDLIPKPLVPVGDTEKPLLEHIIAWLSQNDIKSIVLLVGHKYKQIRNYFADGSRWSVELLYSIDDEYDSNHNTREGKQCGVHLYCDTGGALLKAVENKVITAKTILVWYGDIVSDLDVKSLLEKHRSTGATATLAVADRYKVPVGIPKLRGDDIIKLDEKPWLDDIKPSIGILAVEREAIAEARETLGKSFDIMGDLIPSLIKRGEPIKAYVHTGHWYDVGSIERYQKMPKEIRLALRRMLGPFADKP